MTPRRRIDTLLGTLRYCRGCDEWWPEDAEFWITYTRKRASGGHRAGTVMTQCRACAYAAHRRWYERQKRRARRCSHGACPVITPRRL